MKNQTKNTVVVTVICLFCFWIQNVYSAETNSLEDSVQLEEIRIVKKEIYLLNLLHGLYLSNEQLDKLIPLAEQAKELRRQNREMLATQDPYLQALYSLRDGLYRSTGATTEEKENAQKLKKISSKKPAIKTHEQLGELEDKARGILSDAQIAIVEEFGPCIIPQGNLKDPVLVGQASTTEKEEKKLDLIRRMPDELYNDRKLPIAEFIIEKGEKEKGKMPDDVRSAMVKSYCRKMDEIRKTSPTDFELRKGDLAKSFELFDDDVVYSHAGTMRRSGNIGIYLLSDTAAEVLPKWRKIRAKDTTQIHPANTISEKPVKQNSNNNSEILRQYRSSIGLLLTEPSRNKKISQTDVIRLKQMLSNADKLSDEQKKFKILSSVADELNAKAVTPKSFDSIMLGITWLCQEKDLDVILQGGGEGDVTGLGKIIKEANRNKDKPQQRKEACQILRKATRYLEEFKY
jgi:hypothetical protein